jgi:hypothetical protein
MPRTAKAVVTVDETFDVEQGQESGENQPQAKQEHSHISAGKTTR